MPLLPLNVYLELTLVGAKCKLFCVIARAVLVCFLVIFGKDGDVIEVGSGGGGGGCGGGVMRGERLMNAGLCLSPLLLRQ